MDDEHETVLDEHGKAEPEVLVDDELAEATGVLELVEVETATDKVGDKTDKEDHKNDDGEDLAAVHITGVRNILSATSSSPHVKGGLAVAGLIDIIEVARVGSLLTVDVDLCLDLSIGAFGTVRISHSDARANRLIRALSLGDLLCAGTATGGVLVVLTVGLTNADAGVVLVASRSSLSAEVHVVDGVGVSAVPQSIHISRIVVVKRRKIKFVRAMVALVLDCAGAFHVGSGGKHNKSSK